MEIINSISKKEFLFEGNTQPRTKDTYELLLNRTWRPTLSITGVDGIPSLSNAGNVLRPFTTLKLSVRLPPGVSAAVGSKALKNALESNPPHGAKVNFEVEKSADGWESPAIAPWLEKALHKASQAFYSKPPNFLGEGGSIPFMGMLGEKFPKAQFVITGVLGPESNAHGPNEMLHIPMAKNITACVSSILLDHYHEFVGSSN